VSSWLSEKRQIPERGLARNPNQEHPEENLFEDLQVDPLMAIPVRQSAILQTVHEAHLQIHLNINQIRFNHELHLTVHELHRTVHELHLIVHNVHTLTDHEHHRIVRNVHHLIDLEHHRTDRNVHTLTVRNVHHLIDLEHHRTDRNVHTLTVHELLLTVHELLLTVHNVVKGEIGRPNSIHQEDFVGMNPDAREINEPGVMHQLLIKM